MNQKVLVVDDDPVVRILVSEFLSAQGYEVNAVSSGEACLSQLPAVAPDVLVLDLLMPEMTGIDVLKRLRTDPKTATLPIVMMSSDTESESLVTSHQVTADVYVQKPFGMKEILHAVENVKPRE